MRYQTDYILGTDRCLFRDVTVWDPRHKSDHYLVLGCLPSAPLMEYSKYLGRRKRLPIRPLATLTREDGLFAALRRSVPKPKSREARKNTMILAATWRIVNERVSARQDHARDQAPIRRLVRAINVSLKGDRRRRIEEVGEEV